MGVSWLVGLVVLVLFIWAVARMARMPGNGSPREDSPETILKRRYARGEIDQQEYERRLTELRK
jgi:putative membrane protein